MNPLPLPLEKALEQEAPEPLKKALAQEAPEHPLPPHLKRVQDSDAQLHPTPDMEPAYRVAPQELHLEVAQCAEAPVPVELHLEVAQCAEAPVPVLPLGLDPGKEE